MNELTTGAYLRVERNGKFENIVVERLTDEERAERFSNDPGLIRWFNLVCNKMVELQVELERIFEDNYDECRDGDEEDDI
jgi:hypothetical protein